MRLVEVPMIVQVCKVGNTNQGRHERIINLEPALDLNNDLAQCHTHPCIHSVELIISLTPPNKAANDKGMSKNLVLTLICFAH
jgi:hypothetical protein